MDAASRWADRLGASILTLSALTQPHLCHVVLVVDWRCASSRLGCHRLQGMVPMVHVACVYVEHAWAWYGACGMGYGITKGL